MRFGYSVAAAVAAVSMVAIAPAPAVAKAKKVPPSEITIPAPQEGTGQVVFFRPGGMGGAVACSIHENGEKISSLGGGRYFILNTTPGRHEYSVKTEKTDTLALEVEDGDRKWVACKIKMGIMVGRPDISPSSEEEFRSAKKFAMVDDEDMNPELGAMTSDKVAAALGAPAAEAE
ncbi:MAG: DUF2846 domain-containing protein [Sphingomonadaceae bacterium]|nr:DUF2846 domain-containing protein [Sphingomonadaceae bacterium]